MRPALIKSLSAADASIDQVSPVIDVNQVVNASVVAVSTGSSTGHIYVQASNDVPNGVDSSGLPVVTNWIDITSIDVAITAASIFIIPKFDVCYRWLRLSYSHGNGSAGTISANVKTNGF